MIARLRRQHRRLVGWVAMIAAIGFVAALAVRPARPVDAGLPSPDTSSWTVLGADGKLRAALEGEPGDEWLLVERGSGLVEPDLLVYFSGGDGGAFGASEALLGALGDPGVHRYRLPAFRKGGILVISSRGDERPVAWLALDDLARVR